MIWLIFALLTACVVLAVTRPLGRASTTAAGYVSEIEAYKLQLAELDREEERGTLSKEEADQTRNEISRRLLKANRQGHGEVLSTGKPAGLSANAVFIALATLIATGSLGLYMNFGKPGLPDQPLEARLNAPVEKQTIDIQIANVERRLRANPKDALGWTVIAPVYFRMGQFEKAADAFRKAMLLKGEDEDKLLGFVESLIFANNGIIPEPAKRPLTAVLDRNPKSLRGRFWLALLADQDGRKADAEQIYRQMLSENIPETWRNIAKERIATLTTAPGNDAVSSDQQASADAMQGEQGAMIRGMVERLAERLKENKSDLEGWLKLIRSYAVLKDAGKAQDAAASARQQFASDPRALEQIETLARGLGLKSPDAEGGPPKS
jgi:cytochrome c-type biogenesis protein CcmH